MNWKVIKTKKEYHTAVKRTMDIFQSAPGTTEADELALLLVSVKDYEDRHIRIPIFSQLTPQQKAALDKELAAIAGNPAYLQKWDDVKIQFKKT